MSLLKVENLSVALGDIQIVRDISFQVNQGETLGIVGESGCGKSVTSLAIMGLMSGTPLKITDGSIHFDGFNLLEMTEIERRGLMGTGMSMIFQEPMTSLNPVYRVGEQIVEMILQHEKVSKKAAMERAIELLKKVRIPDPEARVRNYPHQLSGGMRQRVMIAMALACHPKLLIADEPTTALDVTVQAQILDLLKDLQEQTGMGMMLISHDLGVIAENCDSVAVMYRGRIIEAASSEQLFNAPRHPYTSGLMLSIPQTDSDVEELDAIPGRVPLIDELIPGCDFQPRCSRADQLCADAKPEISTQDKHDVVCHHPLEVAS